MFQSGEIKKNISPAVPFDLQECVHPLLPLDSFFFLGADNYRHYTAPPSSSATGYIMIQWKCGGQKRGALVFIRRTHVTPIL